MKEKKKGKVMVGLSGGVDSSVAALLLKQKGYEVTGVTFWSWSFPGSPEDNGCCNINTAEIVAEQLGLEHFTMDVSEKFFSAVVEPSVKSYVDGETPNPCARCNRYVRFDLVLDKAMEKGYDYIATGHHVKKEYLDGSYRLLKGVDEKKDQSYFLYGLGQKELDKSLFPIGHYPKREIYRIAEEQDFLSARIEESQDLCFVPDKSVGSFVEEMANEPVKSGEIVDTGGEVLGEHSGLPFYTIGQRKGLGLETNEAYYVVNIDAENNKLVVGSEEELYSEGLLATDISWIREKPPGDGSQVQIKVRYRTDPVDGRIFLEKGKVKAEFDSPVKAVTPGQKAVFYRGPEVLGGGTIERPLD